MFCLLHQCHETGHSAKDCPNPFSELTEDGKPREQYIPPDVTSDENELFKGGIAAGRNFDSFDSVALEVISKMLSLFVFVY